MNNYLRESGFTFEADILNNTTSEISIDLKLTERVVVKEVNGKMVGEAVNEPKPADPDEQGWALEITTLFSWRTGWWECWRNSRLPNVVN